MAEMNGSMKWAFITACVIAGMQIGGLIKKLEKLDGGQARHSERGNA